MFSNRLYLDKCQQMSYEKYQAVLLNLKTTSFFPINLSHKIVILHKI